MPLVFRRLAGFVLAATASLGCSGSAFSNGEPQTEGGRSDASLDAPTSPESALPESGLPESNLLEGASPDVVRDTSPRPPVELNLPIADDSDDATWINGTDERLHFGASNLTVEVGSDSEMGRVGLRFFLPIPRGSTIVSAHLRLQRVEGTALESESMQVQVFDTSNITPFDEAHVHAPSGHASIWPATVSGFLVGANGKEIESPELKLLVQHIVDAPDWSESRPIGFVLSPDRLDSWVAFGDRSGAAGQSALRVTYTAP